jgi:hypothetical protein
VTVALLVTGCDAASTTPTPSPAATHRATPTPARTPTPTPIPTLSLTKAESALLASMTARYDECRQSEPPSGEMVALVTCTTETGVIVDGARFTTTDALADAFRTQALATKGTRCSAGAYLGMYKVAGKQSGRLGCNGTAGTIAWTVPKLRLYLSATGLTMPELYRWWQYHWTIGSVANGATTGESPVAVPDAAATPSRATEAP